VSEARPRDHDAAVAGADQRIDHVGAHVRVVVKDGDAVVEMGAERDFAVAAAGFVVGLQRLEPALLDDGKRDVRNFFFGDQAAERNLEGNAQGSNSINAQPWYCPISLSVGRM